MGRSETSIHGWIRFFLCCWTITSAQSVNDLFPNPGDVTPVPVNIMVGAYYYPWYREAKKWREEGYLRGKLEVPQQPTLREYDDALLTTVAQHLAWSRKANINLWLTSWWGEGGREDKTILEVILKHADLGDHQIALFYETTSRVKQSEDWDTKRVAPDMEYICETYFYNDNYYKIDGKPVIAMYLTRTLYEKGKLDEVTRIMRDTADKLCQTEIYIIGDQVFGDAPNARKDYHPFDYLDAVTNYDLYGNTDDGTSPRPTHASQGTVDRYYLEQGRWREQANANNASYVPAVSPGYNDRGVRLEKDHIGLSRRLKNDNTISAEGTHFAAQLQQARHLVDPGAGNLLLVNSFNEWNEDSQIEPCIGETTTEPQEYTNGIEYEGYGELYLDILRAATCGFNCQRGAPPGTLRAHPGGPPKEAYPLGLCVGHCENDDECAEGLECFKRNPNTAVPGCIGGEEDNSKTDYCTSGKREDTDGTLFVHPGRPPNEAYPLGLCVGHCENDDQCAEGLYCFKRDPNTAVPGCIGGEEDNSRTDYCTRRETGTLFVQAYPLGLCVGHCDNDDHCAEGLYCFKRDPNTAVPGCIGGEEDNSRTDYCTRRETGTLFVHPGRPPKEAYPLGLCVGHCDNDDECAEGLHCPKRDPNTAVPGCRGGEKDNSRTDYCTRRETGTLFAHPGRPPNEAYPLGLCVGHCDNDDECAEGLYCFKRDPNTAVPGCIGGEEDNSRTDYCTRRETGMLFVHPGRPRKEAYPLGLCVGHCDNDDECAEGLHCPKRDPNTAVPGCIGGEEDNIRTDYCTRRETGTRGDTDGTLFAHPGRPPKEAYPLGLCVGHCDNDNECAEGLHCPKRDPKTAVPGCIGGEEDNSRTDYCTRRGTSTRGDTGTLFVHPGRPPKKAYPLGLCEGHCKKDDHCAEGLYCFKRDKATAVPGCIGGEEDNSRTDYCTRRGTGTRGGTGTLFVHPGRPPKHAYPLGLCVGHCKKDDHCAEGLYCFKRDKANVVPGCIGGEEDDSKTDYCTAIVTTRDEL
jgi:glycoprotein endo-alpha-1,2-mannosidase